MRLRTRIDALTRRVSPATDSEAAINRAVFALHERERAADAPTPTAAEHDAFREACEWLAATEPDWLAHFEAGIAAAIAAHEREHGATLAVPGHGWIGERDYRRLRATVTGDAWHG